MAWRKGTTLFFWDPAVPILFVEKTILSPYLIVLARLLSESLG